jgi:hypothetical protein
VARVILDTGVLVAVARRPNLDVVTATDDIAVPAIVVATGRVLITTDGKADVGDLPELSVRLLTP